MKKTHLVAVPAALCLVLAGSTTTVYGTPAPAAHTAAAASYTLITEPDQGYTPVYNFMETATTSLDMTMYELTDTTAEQDLAAIAARGVTVRVILDQHLEKSSNTAAYNYLNANGVSAVWATPASRTTHQKTITVDGTTSMILTGNLTSQYYATSRDFGVIDTDTDDVAAIEATFNADYAGQSITPDDGDNLVWSPTDAQTQMVNLINSATTSLQIENEEMSDTAIVDALEQAAQNGISVQVTMTNTSNDYTTEFDALASAGGQVATYTGETPIYIHAKVILADSGTANARVFLGSENFSNASLTANRELGLITTDPTILASLNSTLTSDFNGGTAWSG